MCYTASDMNIAQTRTEDFSSDMKTSPFINFSTNFYKIFQQKIALFKFVCGLRSLRGTNKLIRGQQGFSLSLCWLAQPLLNLSWDKQWEQVETLHPSARTAECTVERTAGTGTPTYPPSHKSEK